MGTSDVSRVFKFALAHGACKFESFLNINRAHKSGNALESIQFPMNTENSTRALNVKLTI